MRKKVLIAFGIGAAMLVAIGLLVIIGSKGITARQPNSSEKQLLVSIAALKELGITDLKPETCESYVAKRNLDGSLELEYEYDSDRDPSSTRFLFFKSEAEISSTLRAAKESFQLQIAAYKTGAFLVKGRQIQEMPDLFSSGQEDYSAFIRQNGNIIGNIVVVRQGLIVHSLLIMGLYFDNPEDIKALLDPALEKSKRRNAD